MSPAINLMPLSTTPSNTENLWKDLITGVKDTGNKFIAGVIDANEQFVTNVIREYLR